MIKQIRKIIETNKIKRLEKKYNLATFPHWDAKHAARGVYQVYHCPNVGSRVLLLSYFKDQDRYLVSFPSWDAEIEISALFSIVELAKDKFLDKNN